MMGIVEKGNHENVSNKPSIRDSRSCFRSLTISNNHLFFYILLEVQETKNIETRAKATPAY